MSIVGTGRPRRAALDSSLKTPFSARKLVGVPDKVQPTNLVVRSSNERNNVGDSVFPLTAMIFAFRL